MDLFKDCFWSVCGLRKKYRIQDQQVVYELFVDNSVVLGFERIEVCLPIYIQTVLGACRT